MTSPRLALPLLVLGVAIACLPDGAVVDPTVVSDRAPLAAKNAQSDEDSDSDDDSDDSDSDDDESSLADLTDAEWSEPVNLGPVVNSNAADVAPFLSKDGLSLYFSSNRTVGGFGQQDIWVSQRACVEGCPWGAPLNLGSIINTPAVDSRATLSNDEHFLYFFSNREGGHGDTDIWISHRADTEDDFGWEPAVNLGPDINTTTAEQAAWFVKNELFFSRGLPTAGQSDIYVVSMKRDGRTRGPAVLVAELHDPTVNDAGVTVSKNGKEMIFSSSRAGALGSSDHFTSTRGNRHKPWSTPVSLGSLVNSTATEQQPSLSHDGRTLVWSSNRAGSVTNPSGAPTLDIWMSTRRRIDD